MRAAGREAGLVGVLLVAAALSGCRPFGGDSASTQLSGRDVAKTIDDKLPPQLHGVQRAGKAKCPATVALDADKTADCTMVADGQTVKVKVARDGSGYSVSLDQAVVSAAVLEQNLASTYRQKFSFYCGRASVRVVNPGDTIECRGTPTSGGKPTMFDVTIQNTSGKYSADVHHP